MDIESGSFVWNVQKEIENVKKHGVGFATAARVFADARRKIYVDEKHSEEEKRYFCVGKVRDKVLTVRFVYRGDNIRILGAGYWRKGKKHYEKESD